MINIGQLLGRVGTISTKILPDGGKVTNLSMVTSKKYKSKDGEKKEKTTWHNVTMYAKLAEISEKYVNVGDLLFVQGEMDNQKYIDKEGVEKFKAFIIAHDLKLLPKTKEHKAEPKPEPVKDWPMVDDEIPF